jgi:ABC-type nickel/cobalt efflux system permease component RcnA
MTWYHEVLSQIVLWQKSLNSIITQAFRDLQADYFTTLLWLAAICFLYGFLHAAGPGHGKTIVMSWFLSGKSKTSRVFRMGYLMALTHAISGLITALVLKYIIKVMVFLLQMKIKDTMTVTMKISGGLLILIGLWLLYDKYSHAKKHAEDEEHSHDSETAKKWFSKYFDREIAIALSAGIVPCPGVSVVLLTALAMKQVLAGVVGAIAMSIGMGLTISLSGWIAVKMGASLSGLSDKVGSALSWMSILLVMLMGAFLITF